MSVIKELMKKYFNTASAETQEEVDTMTDQEKATLAAAENKSAELAVALEVTATTLAEKEAAYAEMMTKYEAASAALAQSAEAQATLVANAKATVLQSRTASLSAIMGDVKGPATAAKLEALDDAAFAVVLDSYAASFEAESKSEMFQEKGVAAEAKPVVEDESREMALIKAKQAAARLQTN